MREGTLILTDEKVREYQYDHPSVYSETLLALTLLSASEIRQSSGITNE